MAGKPGEVEFEVGGKKHLLCLDANVMIAAQAAMGLDDEAFWALVLNRITGSLARWRALVHLGLLSSEPDITEEEVGRLITLYTSRRMIAVVAEAIEWALHEDEAPKGGKARSSVRKP